MFKTRYKSHHDAEFEYNSLVKKTRSSQEELNKYLNSLDAFSVKDNVIYIHIPFCDRICSFCNMNRRKIDNTLNTYVNQLVKQILVMGSYGYFRNNVIKAIYFGGGTPTVLSPKHFELILGSLHRAFKITSDCEITCETTIHNFTNAHLTKFNLLGINRISIGIQTFQSAGREFFNRTYNKEEVIKRLKEIRKNFKGCLSIDKIYNYPGETREMLLDDIKQIIDLDVDSISFYSLMIHKGSKLSESLDVNDFSQAQDQEFHDLFVQKLLEHGDFEFLELTKIARKGRDRYCYMGVRNNNGNTIPLGRGAGGQIDQFQIYNMDFDKIMIVKSEDYKNEVASNIYGICQYPVINKQELLKFIKESLIIDEINSLIEKGYLENFDKTWKMTEKGIFYGNNIGGFLARKYLEAQVKEL